MKSGVVVLVGRPSAGKSTLVNALCGQKVAIVAPYPQTTRNVIRGIVTERRGQLVLLDTPGLHESDRKLNHYLTSVVTGALPDVDAVLYAIDSSRLPGPEEERIVGLVREWQERLVVAVTKTDLRAPSAPEVLDFLNKSLKPVAVCPISAQTAEGMELLRDELFKLAPDGEPMYGSEFYTDQPPEFRAAEIIREKAIERVREELPHALYVEIEDMERKDEGKRLWIRAVIAVERESQKGILIGKGGAQIREIRIAAERELVRVFPYAVSLDLRVKVQAKWRHDDRILKRLIY